MTMTSPRGPGLPGIGPAPDQDLEGWGGPGVEGPADRDVEGLGPDGDVDHLDSTHRTSPVVDRMSPELGLDPRADDDGLDTDDAYGTEAYDSGLGQDAGLEPGEGLDADGSDTRSR